MRIFFNVLITTFIMAWAAASFAAEIEFVNGDHISGEITKVTEEKVTVNTDLFGELSFEHAKISTIDEEDAASYLARHHTITSEKDKDDVEWQRVASIGYTQSGGNTEKSSFNGEVKINRKTGGDEWTMRWTGYYASSDEVTDAREYYGMLRYAYSYGHDLRWYHFFKLEGKQDKFANVSYRITPSSGIGYWFFDEERFKAMAEMALGYEYTNYHDATDSEGELVLVPRGFVEKVIWNDLKFKEDVTMYPSLEDFGEFRLRSETSLVKPLSEKISWRISFIDEYDSDPTGTADSNDYKLISGLDINF